MRFRVLLILLLGVLLNHGSLWAQGLKYNGKVNIEIKISKVQAYGINENKDGTPDNKLDIYKKYGSNGDYNHYKQITGTCSDNKQVWEKWTSLNVSLPYGLSIQIFSIINLNLKDYFDNKNDRIYFKLMAWEKEVDFWGDVDKRYCRVEEYDILEIIGSDLSPGWHTKRMIIGDDNHWAVEFEYSITPPPPTFEQLEEVNYPEGGIVPLRVGNVGPGVEYEWTVCIDSATYENEIYGSHVSWEFINCFEWTCAMEFPWDEIFPRDEEVLSTPWDELSQEQLIEITNFFELQVELGRYDECVRSCFYENQEPNYENLLDFVPAVDSKTGMSITTTPENQYSLPESNKFHRNMKFKVNTIVRTTNKDVLRSVTSDLTVVDVFPHFPKIQTPVNTKKVTCYGGYDGAGTIVVHGDVGNGVDKYRAVLMKVLDLKTKVFQDKVTTQDSKFVFSDLDAGHYRVEVSNFFTRADASVYFDDYDEQNNGFMMGHDSVDFTIEQNPKLTLTDFSFESTGNCDEYRIIKPVPNGGVPGYSYALEKDGTYGDVNIMGPALRFSGVENSKSVTLYMKDAVGCPVSYAESKTRNKVLGLGLEVKDPIICNGGQGSIQMAGENGSGVYHYYEVIGETENPLSPLSDGCSEFKAGDHNIRVKDSAGCSATEMITLNQPDPVLILEFNSSLKANSKHISCNGGEDGEVKFKVSGGTPGYAYTLEGPVRKIDDDVLTEGFITITGLKAGDYTLTVKDAKGCSCRTSKPFTLLQPDSITVILEKEDYSGYNYKCKGMEEDLTLVVEGGTPPYRLTYNRSSEVYIEKSITGSGGSAMFRVKGTNPSINITDAMGCSPQNFSVSLKEPEKLGAEIGKNDYDLNHDINIKCVNGTDEIRVTPQGGIPPYKINLTEEGKSLKTLSSFGEMVTFPGLSAGHYKVTVKGAYGDCDYDEEVTLFQPEDIQIGVKKSNYNGYNIQCHGGEDYITVKPSGGVPPYNIKVSNGEDYNVSVTDTTLAQKFMGMGAGAYSVVIVDSNGCSKSIAVKLNQPDQLTLRLKSSTYNNEKFNIPCSYGTGWVQITPDGGIFNGTTFKYTVRQTDPQKVDTDVDDVVGPVMFRDLNNGTHIYRVSDANKCEETVSITLTKPKPLKITNVDLTPPSCHQGDMGAAEKKEDGQMRVTAVGGYVSKGADYKFHLFREVTSTNIEVFKTMEGTSGIFEGLKTDKYWVVVEDANACYDTVKHQELSQHDLLHIDKVNMNITEPSCYDFKNGAWQSVIKGGTVADGFYTFNILKDGESFRGGEVAKNATGKASDFTQSNLSSGQYTIEITDDLGCYYQQETILKQPDSIVNMLKMLGVNVLGEYQEANFECFGSKEGSKLVVTGGTANYTVDLTKDGIPFQNLKDVGEDVSIITNQMEAGSYSILTTDTRGCQSAKVNFRLNQPSEINIKHSGPSYRDVHTNEVFDYTCWGADELIDVTVEGGTPPYRVTYNGEPRDIPVSGATAQFLVTGTSPNFTVLDKLDCSMHYKPTLKQPQPLELTLTPNIYTSGVTQYNIKCYGGMDTIQVSAIGGIAPYTFELTGNGRNESILSNGGSGIFTDLPAGNYSVRVVGNFNDECDQTQSIILVEPDELVAVDTLSNFNGFQVRCNGLSDSIAFVARGGIPPYTLRLTGDKGEQLLENVGPAKVRFRGLTSGTYTLTLTDKYKACEFTSSYTLTEPKVLSFAMKTSSYAGGHEIRCSYLRDSVTIVPRGGLPVAMESKYSIVQTDENSNRKFSAKFAGERAVFRNLDEGKYIYEISDANGCSTSDFVVLSKPDSLEITHVGFSIPSCHEDDRGDETKQKDGEIKVNIRGGVDFGEGSYDFLLNRMTQPEAKDRLDSLRVVAADFQTLPTGEYIVRVKDINGCLGQKDSLFLDQPDWLHLESFIPTIPECYNADNGYWTSTIAGGTVKTNTYNYNLYKDTVVIRAGTTGTEWNQDNLREGVYIIKITDDLGCCYKEKKVLLQPDVMDIAFDVMGVSAFGAADGAVKAKGSGGNGGYRYQWYHKGELLPGGQTQKIEQLMAGEYTVEVWDEKNCPYGDNDFGKANGLKKSVEVKEPGSQLKIVASPIETSYFGASDGVLEVSAVGGWPYSQWPGYQFSLNHGEWQITQRYENLPADWYQLRVKDSKGVMDSLCIEIKQPEKLVINLDITNCLCKGDDSGQVKVSVLGGTPPYQYALNQSSGFTSSNEFTGLKAGTYRVLVKDKLGNIQSEFVEVGEPEALQVELLKRVHSTCNSSSGSAQIKISGGSPEYYIRWGGIYPEEKLAPVNLAAGTYRVCVIDQNACVDSLKFKIEEKNGPEIQLKKMLPVSCHQSKDGVIEVTVKGGTKPYDFVWNELPGINTPLIGGLGKGSYSVVVSDANNCFDEAAFEVSGPDILDFYVSSLSPPNCVGVDDGMVQLKAEGGTPAYIFSVNGQENDSGLFPGLGAGPLKLKVSDGQGCQEQLNVELSAPVPVVINMPTEYYLCRNQSLPITAGIEGATSLWYYEDEEIGSDPEIEVFQAGRYNLLLTSAQGCEAHHVFNIYQLDYEVAADFVIPDEGIVGDTLVGVDISWELPDSIHWHVPDALEVVRREEASIWLRALMGGEHSVGLTVFKEECSDYLEKTITVEASGKRKACLMRPNDIYINEAILYPNPNRGTFSVKVVLNKPADASVEILDVHNAACIDSRKGRMSAVYQFNFNDHYYFVPNRVYVALVRVGQERRALRFVVH